MKLNYFGIVMLLVVISIFSSCQKEEESVQLEEKVLHKNDEIALANSYLNRSSETTCNFEYQGNEGPEYWSDLCSGEWTDCGGNSQSPINIETNQVVENESLKGIRTYYFESTLDIVNNGHTIQFNYSPGSTTKLDGVLYNLLQFHFHTDSEHTINGYHYPMEIHFVHQDPKTKLLAVVGVFVKQGKTNGLLATFMNKLPKNENEKYQSNRKYKADNLLPKNLKFYTYSGSLTTPGCAEIVTWFVLKKTITASKSQLDEFKQIMHKNNRPTQLLNDRYVMINDD